MRKLTMGSLPLYNNGFTVLNEGGLLSWEATSPTVLNRGAQRSIVSGSWTPGDMASIALQIMVRGSSADDAAEKMSRLYRELYAVRTGVLGSAAAVTGGQSFDVRDTTGSTTWVLYNCHLSSSVEVDRRDGGKTFIVSFTLTPLVPCWEAAEYSIHEFSGTATYFVPVGDFLVGNFQIIWQFDNELGSPTLRDGYSGSTTRVELSNSDAAISSGQSAWVRYDSDAYTCGWVSSARQWTGGYSVNLGELNKYLTIPEQGSVLAPFPSSGNAALNVTGCTSAVLRYRKTKAIV